MNHISINVDKMITMATKISMREFNEERLLENDRILIFVSFSMPMQSLREWLYQANLAGSTLIIRGLVNNSFKKTISKVNELLNGNKGKVQIAPNLFKQYNIQEVPAVVVEKNDGFDVMYGNVPLIEMLKYLRNKYSSVTKS